MRGAFPVTGPAAAPMTAAEAYASARPTSVRRAAEYMARHAGETIEGDGAPPWFRHWSADGDVLDEATDLGRLMERVEAGEHRTAADEADLAALREWFGRAWSVVYFADITDGGRWEARPLSNVGRAGEAVRAPTAAQLAWKLGQRL